MKIKVLVVDKKTEPAMNILGSFGEGDLEATIIRKADMAIKSLRRNKYDLIILGDRLVGGGDTFDVGLEIKSAAKNKRVPVICVGTHQSRTVKLKNLLKPHSLQVNTSDQVEVAACVSKIKNTLIESQAKK